ncbi:hypothetical protein R3P38DRAFT_2779201 [Favolaschia claudopus]|uniref:CCHC-type domain-containing protein n=1 Tax=Favolaschia claudopus TaxID=2862362 RepID=A0AAW0BBV6_9AGAR
MQIDDAEYAPTYYSILALDQTGNAARCVKPPQMQNNWSNGGGRPPPRFNARENNGARVNSATQAATYPNNIPLGGGNREPPRPANNGAPLPPECFGCGKDDGHRMFDCVEIKELLQRGVVKHDENTGKLCMADGTFIRRRPGEYIAPAARRLAPAPQVMFGVTDYALTKAISRMDSPAAHMVIQESEDEEMDFEDEESEGENQTDDDEGEVYLTLPRRQLQVNAADRTVPSTRAARKQTFDGVHIPKRPRPDPGSSQPKDSETTIPNVVKTAQTKVTPGKIRDILEDVQPYDARQPRKVSSEDVEMKDAQEKRSTRRTHQDNSQDSNLKDQQKNKEGGSQENAGRRSEIQGTVHLPGIVERILDLEIPINPHKLAGRYQGEERKSSSYWSPVTLTLAIGLAQNGRPTTEVLHAEVDRRVMAIIADDAGEETGKVPVVTADGELENSLNNTNETSGAPGRGAFSRDVAETPEHEYHVDELNSGTARNLGASSGSRALAGLDASNKLVWEQLRREIVMLLRAWVQFVLLLGLRVATMLERGIRSDDKVRRVKKEHETTHLNSLPTSSHPNPPNEPTDTSFMQISEHVVPVRCCSESMAGTGKLTITRQVESERLVSSAATLLPAVEARIQQLEASLIDDLPVRPRRGFGKMGSRPLSTAPASLDVVAATIEARDAATRHEQEVRPAQLWTAQIQRVNGNVLPGGQEVISSVFLNTEMRVQDPATGEMGSETGHAQVTFFKRPHERVHDWKLCAPYASQRDVRRETARAQARNRERDRRIKKESHSPTALTNDEGHYLSHPVDAPPPVNAAEMTTVGMSADGTRMVLKAATGTHGSPIRPGTPIPPTILHDNRPRILPSAPPSSPAISSMRLNAGDEPYVTIRRLFAQRLDERLRDLAEDDESEGGERQMDVEEGEVVERRGDESAEGPSDPNSVTTPLGQVGHDKSDTSSEAEMADVSSDEEQDQWAADRRRPIPLSEQEIAVANHGYRNGGRPNQAKLSVPPRLPRLPPILTSLPPPFSADNSPSSAGSDDSLPPLRPVSPVTSDEPSPSDESSAASITQSASNESTRGGGEPPTTDGAWVRRLSEEVVVHNESAGVHAPRPLGTRHPLFISGILRNDDDTIGTTSDLRERPPASVDAPVRQPTTMSALPSAATSAEASAQRILPAGKVLLPTYEVALAVKDIHHSIAVAAVGVNERAAAHVYTQRCMMDESNHHVRKESMEDQWAVAPAHEFLDIAGHGLRGELDHEAMSKVVYVNNEGLALERDRERLDRARVRSAREVTLYLDDIFLDTDDPHKRMHIDPAVLDSISTAEGAFMRILDAEPMMTPLQAGEVARQFSQYARRRGAAYCAALNIVRIYQSKFVDDLARARAFLLEFLDRLIALGLQRHIQQQPAVIHCLSPHPSALLKVAEFDRIRIAHAGFHSHGYHLISEVLSRVLHVQFKREELISHLLYAGVLDTEPHTANQVLGAAFHYPFERPSAIASGASIPRPNHHPSTSVAPVRSVPIGRERDSRGDQGLSATRGDRGDNDRRRIIQMGRSGDVVAQRNPLRPSLAVHAGDHSSNVANTTQHWEQCII